MKLKQSTKTVLMIVGIFVGVVGVGLGAYFAMQEPPPRHVVMRDMVADMVRKLELHFHTLNEEPRAVEEDLRWFIYNPVVARKEGGIEIRRYGPGDTRPLADLQRLYHFDPEAVVFLDIPCDHSWKVFDTTHKTSNEDKMIVEHCPAKNVFYFGDRTDFSPTAPRKLDNLVLACRHCAKPYNESITFNPGYTADERDIRERESRYFQDIMDEESVFNKAAVEKGREIANRYGISNDKTQESVRSALEFVWIRPQDDAEDEEERAELERKWEELKAENLHYPIGFRGTIRYMEIVRMFDPFPRIHRVKDNRVTRADKISEAPDPEAVQEIGHPVDRQPHRYMGYLLWRNNFVHVYEVDFEYRGGNIKFVYPEAENAPKSLMAPEPRLLARIDPFYRDPETVKKAEEQAAELEKRRKEERAKAKGEGGAKKPPEPTGEGEE